MHLRQLDILPEEVWDRSIAIVGVGGIGSTVAYMLAKMGCRKLEIYDFDTVDEHNISTQMYGVKDLGVPKVIALKDSIVENTGTEIYPFVEKVEELPETDIVILALDSMDERIKLINSAKESGILPEWLIEARMGLEFSRVYAVQPLDTANMETYEKTLYPSQEASELPCTGRAVAYNTFFIASIICSQVKKILNSEELPLEIMGDIGKFGFFTMKRR